MLFYIVIQKKFIGIACLNSPDVVAFHTSCVTELIRNIDMDRWANRNSVVAFSYIDNGSVLVVVLIGLGLYLFTSR